MVDFIEEFVQAIHSASPQSHERLVELRALATRIVDLADSHTDVDELGIAADALSELLQAAKVFSPWHDRPKLTVFGSARIKPGNPLYEMATQLSRRMAERGWITVSGAGPGIMEAAAKGAGIEHTLGVNIDLPFEQSPNAYIDADTRLVEMKYFFTRKVALTKESLAFTFFPGGLGTMDELFELFTLLHTGKSKPAPMVLVDVPEGHYWEKWMTFIESAVTSDAYVEEGATRLVEICHSLDEVVAAIERFHANFVTFSLHDDRGRIVLRMPPSPDQLAALSLDVPQFAGGDGYLLEDPTTIGFSFDGRSYVALRLLIDEINDWVY